MASLARWLDTHSKALVAVFFVALFLVGCVSFWGYGVSWDEPHQFRVSEAAYNHVFNGAPWPEVKAQLYYGTVFELPVAMLMHGLGITVDRTALLLKHFLTFLCFMGGVWFFYLFCKHHFKSRWAGLLGALFFVLSPRIFADAFYNPKDIPNMVFFTIAMFTLTRFLEEKNWKWVFLHALACALATGIRLTAMIIPMITLVFFVLISLRDWKKDRLSLERRAGMAAAFVGLWIAGSIAVWPYMWEHALTRFLDAYHFMSTLGVDAFYFGEKIYYLPASYVPVWITISTPLLYNILFWIGIVSMAVFALRHPVRWMFERTNEAVFLSWLILPVLAVFVSGAGIFDGWRHMYFIYPAYLLIALTGARYVAVWLKANHGWTTPRLALGGVFAANSLWIAVWLWNAYPVQNAYFSIPAAWAQHNFDLDYWGLSFRPAFEYVVSIEDDPVIPIWATSSPAYSTLAILPPEIASRIVMVEESQAKYVLNNYRLFEYKQDYPHQEIHAIYSGGVKVLGIYKMRD